MRRGFTLIEVLIVLVIAVILGLITFANLTGYRRAHTLELDRDKIVSILQDARQRSLVQEDGLRWNVYFDNVGSDDFYVLFSGATYETGTTTMTTYLSPDIGFTTPTSSSTISFSTRTGTTTPATITIGRISNAAASSTVTINENGTIDY